MANETVDLRYRAADGSPITHGKPMWNYYDGYVVLVQVKDYDADPDDQFHEHWDGWFRTKREDGLNGPLLNGERMCSLEHARKVGWLKDTTTEAPIDVWAALRDRLAHE